MRLGVGIGVRRMSVMKIILAAMLAIAVVNAAPVAYGQDTGGPDKSTSAGADGKKAAKTTAQDTKNAAQKSGHASKTAGQDTVKDTKVGAKDTASGAKSGTKATEDAAKTTGGDREWLGKD